jgi:hypothetical protein
MNAFIPIIMFVIFVGVLQFVGAVAREASRIRRAKPAASAPMENEAAVLDQTSTAPGRVKYEPSNAARS